MIRCVFHFLYCMLAILCIGLLCAESIHMNKCMETERSSLLKFKDALIHRKANFTSWKGEECCKWEGISCDNFTHHVTSLDLNSFGLGGHHLHQLIVLRLRANKFQGSIPTSMCNLSLLQILDLSQNNITGEIPQCFSHIVALSNLTSPRHILYHSSVTLSDDIELELDEFDYFNDKEILAWKGSNREYGKILGLMTMIDLSCNHLTGEIPQSITKLVALASLNLSMNNLTGLIPKHIGHMKMLESLDLSRNHLYGRMPTSFSNLTFLSYMNLSFNNLEGNIPTSTQLDTFGPSSYVGNSRLCGPPLTNLCPGDVVSPTRSHDKHVTSEEDEDKLITFGFYVSLVIGFFVVFWGVCGTLLIKTTWRHAYFKFFNNVNDWIHVTLAVFVNRLKKRFQVKD